MGSTKVIHDIKDDPVLHVSCQFGVDIFIVSVSRMGGQEGGYLEDVEGS